MKKSFKIMSLMLAGALAFNLPVYAAEIQTDKDDNSVESITYQDNDEEEFSNETSVFAYVGSSYEVTIPKVIVLSGATKSANYYVKVDGDIAGYQSISVVPDEEFDLTSANKPVKKATISQDKISWAASDFDTNALGVIEASDLDAGKWEGSFNFTISLEGIAGDVVLPTLISNDIDVYSAAADEIYYLDGEEKKVVCTTDNSGHGLILADTLKAGEYTFYSSIAKNPDNLDENYSQKTTLTNSSDVVMLMPAEIDKMLYWYGYVGNDLENYLSNKGWGYSSAYSTRNPTYDTNKIIVSTTNYMIEGVCAKNIISGPTATYVVVNGKTGSGGTYGTFSASTTKNNQSTTTDTDTEFNSGLSKYSCITKGDRYVAVLTSNGRAFDLYAFWYD